MKLAKFIEHPIDRDRPPRFVPHGDRYRYDLLAQPALESDVGLPFNCHVEGSLGGRRS